MISKISFGMNYNSFAKNNIYSKEYLNSFQNNNVYTDISFKGKSDINSDLFEKNTDNHSKTIVLPAKRESFADLTQWIKDNSDDLQIDKSYIKKLFIVSDEILTNVSSYAYPDKEGNIGIVLNNSPEAINIQFCDNGIKYNPLEEADPNFALRAKEKTVGGLGIYLVKKLADSVSYEYSDNKNILKIQILKK